MEGLGSEDFKIPRIKLIQPMNPEVQSFPGEAKPGEFWHTGAAKSLGKEFKAQVAIATKRVILWNPREAGGGILAFSADGNRWISGGNGTFQVKLKDIKQPVVWETKGSVKESGLTAWGSKIPGDTDSPPAAQVHYEYMLYLPDHPELSPVVMGVARTGLRNAKNFNTQLAMPRQPIQSILVRIFSDTKQNDGNTYWVPNFATAGFVPKAQYEAAKKIAETQQHYTADYEQDEVSEDNTHKDY